MKNFGAPILMLSLISCFFGMSCATTTSEELNDVAKDMAFDHIMAEHKGEMADCFYTNRKPGTENGEILFIITTGNLGGVIDSTVDSSEGASSEIEECIRKTFLSLKFPEEPRTNIRYRVKLGKL